MAATWLAMKARAGKKLNLHLEQIPSPLWGCCFEVLAALQGH